MAQNIEIKARASSFQNQQKLAEELSDKPVETLHQIDTFFKVPQGRLKLREFPNSDSELIYYQRGDSNGPKLSDYQITKTSDPMGLKTALAKAYGIRASVEKTRYLFMRGRSRLHFDQVSNLGNFIEIEVVMSQDESVSAAESEVQELMELLQIKKEDLIEEAYVDLITKKDKSAQDDMTIRHLVYR